MIKLFNDLRHSRLFLEMVVELSLFAVLILLFPYKLLNDIFNFVAIAVWSAVLVSYLPIVLSAMRKPYPTADDRLAAGICASGITILT